MFDRLMNRFIKSKRADAPPVSSGLVRPISKPVDPSSKPIGPRDEPIGPSSKPIGPRDEPIGPSYEPAGLFEPAGTPEPVKVPAAISPDRIGLPPAIIQDEPPMAPLSDAATSMPAEEMAFSTPLPEGIDPSRVSVMRRDVKKTGEERFKYTDRPLKPLNADGKKPDIIKYNDKGAKNTAIYQAAPVMPHPKADDREHRGAEVFKYTPPRVGLKS